MSQSIWNTLRSKQNRPFALKMLKALNYSKTFLDIPDWSSLTPDEKHKIMTWYNHNKSKGQGYFENKDPLTKKAPKHSRIAKEAARKKKLSDKIGRMDATPTVKIRPAPKKTEKLNQETDYIDTITENTKKYRPIKYGLQLLFPTLAPPIEVFYLVFTNLNTIRGVYNFTNSPSEELNKPLNETIGDVVGKITKTAMPLIDSNILEITDKSIEYLNEKNVFKDLIEVVGLEEHYSNSFKEFYNTSLKNSLNQEVKGNTKS